MITKDKVRNTTNTYIRNGILKKAAICQICGNDKNIETHHLDYEDPKNVLFLCRSCHREKHRGGWTQKHIENERYSVLILKSIHAEVKKYSEETGIKIRHFIENAIIAKLEKDAGRKKL